MFNNFSENSSVYETMSKNVVEPEKPQTTSQYETYALHAGLERRYVLIRTHMPTHPDTHMHARARTHTHKYVILTAFPRQQWFRERASLLCYTYIACIILLLWCVVPFMDHGLPRPGFRNVRNLSPTPDPQPGGSEYVSPEWLAPTAARLESIWFQSSLVHATPSPC